MLAVLIVATLMAPEAAGVAGAQTPPTIPSSNGVPPVAGNVQPTPRLEADAAEAGRQAGTQGTGAPIAVGEGPGTAPSPAPPGAGAAKPPGFTTFSTGTAGVYFIQVQHRGMMLDVEGVSKDNGARVIRWPANGQINQMWRLVPVGTTGSFNIIAQHSGKALDVGGVSRDDGALIIQWPSSGGTNQMWRPAISGL